MTPSPSPATPGPWGCNINEPVGEAGGDVFYARNLYPGDLARWRSAPALLAALEAIADWSDKHGHPVYPDKCNEPGNIARSALAAARGAK